MSELSGITPGDPAPSVSYDPNEVPQHLPQVTEEPLPWAEMLLATRPPDAKHLDAPLPQALLRLGEHVEEIRNSLWWLHHGHTKTDTDFVSLVDTVFQTLQQIASDNVALAMRVETLEQRLAAQQIHH